jgi:hypothetical protein
VTSIYSLMRTRSVTGIYICPHVSPGMRSYLAFICPLIYALVCMQMQPQRRGSSSSYDMHVSSSSHDI